ncbi:hypothetical protein MFUL124B02_03740 [Myxococcus fulvus 124B02]|nr:hypothetical protein MFUL124B02_03740 [Myxococcus fulvus 124B02]
MNRRIYIGLVIVVVVLLSVITAPYCGRWWRIDKCLDSGGAWDEQTEQCVSKEPTAP